MTLNMRTEPEPSRPEVTALLLIRCFNVIIFYLLDKLQEEVISSYQCITTATLKNAAGPKSHICSDHVLTC